MTLSAAVCRCAPQEILPWPIDTFAFRWALDDTAVEIWEPTRPTNETPDVASVLPAAVSKTANDGDWNRTTDPRLTHHIMIGPNTLVGRHSIMGTTRYNDDLKPHGYVWDWRVNTMHGPLVLPGDVRQLEGFIKHGLHLYFVGVDATSFKAQLYRTNFNLTDPAGGPEIGFETIGGETAAIPSSRSIERLMISGNKIAILEGPGNGNAFTNAWVWDVVAPASPALSASVSIGSSFFYVSQKGDRPSQPIASSDSFSILSNQPAEITGVSLAAVTLPSLFNTGSWGTFLFGGVGTEAARNFTIMDDETTVLYTYKDTAPPAANKFGRRTWRTGVVIDADAPFDSFGFPQIGESTLFPFEE